MALSGCRPRCCISDVSPLPSSELTPRTAATVIASQMPMVRHGWVALLRARRSVNEAAAGVAIGSLLSGSEPFLAGLFMDMSGPTPQLVTTPASSLWAARPVRIL